jgi:hypothetical protein
MSVVVHNLYCVWVTIMGKLACKNLKGGDKILASTEMFVSTENIDVDKLLALTKFSRRQKSRIDKNLASTKCWRMRRSISLLFGLAESTAADFSQTSLMISYISQKVLIPPHAVAKCAFASGRPAFMRTLSRTVPACCTCPPCRKCHKYWRRQNIGARQDFTDFRKTIAVNISAHRRPIKNL